jgi:hypothetical protein
VVGVERSAAAVDDARRNAARNRVPNASFLLADLESGAGVLGDRARVPRPDVVVLDPARAGLSPGVLAFLLRRSTKSGPPRRVVYVSCDPATLARDLALLCGRPHAQQQGRQQRGGGGEGGGETSRGSAGGARGAVYRLEWVRPVDMYPNTVSQLRLAPHRMAAVQRRLRLICAVSGVSAACSDCTACPGRVRAAMNTGLRLPLPSQAHIECVALLVLDTPVGGGEGAAT